jgi:2-oxoglutarate dehydrogenase E1 component
LAGVSDLPITSVFNDGYIAEQFEAFRKNPDSVDESWRQFFRFAQSLSGGSAVSATPATSDALAPAADVALLRIAAGGAALAAAIRRFGYLAVAIDPLGSAPPGSPELKAEFHGVTEAELEKLPASALGGATGTAADFIRELRERYSATLACEFDHLGNDAERQWLRQQIESGAATQPLSPEEKKAILQRLTQVDGLERFLGKAFVSMKRFSIEGVDLLVPMIDETIRAGARAGARNVVIGMAHRGRLNVLTHVLGKSYRTLLEEFDGHFPDANSESDTGDVKYHLGGRTKVDVDGTAVDVELAPNPSHLEFVNSVVTGIVRARQRSASRRDESKVVPVVVHGDASFPGEGVVAETLNMSMLRGFRVGGTVHLIANNQVGFTTNPTDSRSTRFASDLARGFDVPIVHVNGDDAEAGIQATRLALAYRARFGKDFVIDIVGYRRHGHNESDQPSFTQPKLYQEIAGHPTPREVWGSRLVRERVVTEEDVKRLDDELRATLQATYEEMKKAFAGGAPHGAGGSKADGPDNGQGVETAVKAEKLVSLNEQLLSWPSTFKLHPTIQRTLPRRREALQSAIDWGHAEALAFASLLTDGVGVRLTGQDAERGTFSHRQAVLHDTNTGETFTPLANLPQGRAPFEIYNSPLSETAVLGFEYGFSVATAGAEQLVLWEAQFGDFVNVAQPVIDQFIAAGRAKWGQASSLVMLLPHGYEGQGPEHSSARLERFLQMCAEGNMVVAAPSTPAQYFHVLRRQAMSGGKQPLILMQPKSLLRLPAAASKLDDLVSGQFQPLMNDDIASRAPDQVTRLVFCSGKIYYDLTEKERPPTVAIVRIEEIAPWPRDVSKVVDMYPNIEEVVWAQEEPKNMGAWTYVQPRLRASIGTMPMLRYIGRPERASPAEGHKSDHDQMQAKIVADVLSPAPSRKQARVGAAAGAPR